MSVLDLPKPQGSRFGSRPLAAKQPCRGSGKAPVWLERSNFNLAVCPGPTNEVSRIDFPADRAHDGDMSLNCAVTAAERGR